MDVPAPEMQGDLAGRYTVERYFRLVTDGVLEPDDRVELLEGVVVTMAPQDTPHAAAVGLVGLVLTELVGRRAAVRCQLPLVVGPYSVPEPDIAVVPGTHRDYATTHPRSALLVLEVAGSSLKQDRLTKSAIYARGGIPEYWIVNLSAGRLEVHREPDRGAGRFAVVRLFDRGASVEPTAFPGTAVAVDDLLPVLAD